MFEAVNSKSGTLTNIANLLLVQNWRCFLFGYAREVAVIFESDRIAIFCSVVSSLFLEYNGGLEQDGSGVSLPAHIELFSRILQRQHRRPPQIITKRQSPMQRVKVNRVHRVVRSDNELKSRIEIGRVVVDHSGVVLKDVLRGEGETVVEPRCVTNQMGRRVPCRIDQIARYRPHFCDTIVPRSAEYPFLNSIVDSFLLHF